MKVKAARSERADSIGRHGQDARSDPSVTSRGNHDVKGFEQSWMIKLAGNLQSHRQVTRAHEQDIDPWNRRNLRNIVQRGRGLNLHDAEQRLVHALIASNVSTELARPVVPGDAAVALGRIPQVSDRVANLNGRIETRKHHAGGPKIQDVTDPNPISRLDAHEDGYAVCAAPARSCATRPSSPPAPCSRSTRSQSKPARAHTSAAPADPKFKNVPRVLSPARTRSRNVTTRTLGWHSSAH